MLTKVIERLRIPGFVYKGFRFSEAEIATDIERLKSYEPAYNLPCTNLHKRSTTLAEIGALHELALAARLGEDLAGVPEAAVKAALTIYENIHSRIGAGEWTDDACDYDNGKKVRGAPLPKSFVPVRWIRHPVLKKRDKGWEALLGENSEELYTFLPPDGFVIPTVDGFYCPGIGTPFATERDKKKAVKLLNKAGLDGEKEASYFCRSGRNEGVYRVIRQHVDYYGPFRVFVNIEPDFKDEYIGWRSINRLEQLASPQQHL